MNEDSPAVPIKRCGRVFFFFAEYIGQLKNINLIENSEGEK